MSFFDQFRDINRVISFTPANIFEAMGRTWELDDDDFHYSNNPNDRFNREYNNKMTEEWDWRVREAAALEHKLASVGLKRPKKRAMSMPRGTPQEFNFALNRFREENNRMQIRYHRVEYGIYGSTRFRSKWDSDCEMSDKD